MAKQYGSEHLTQGICLRSEVPVADGSGLTHSRDDLVTLFISAERGDPLAYRPPNSSGEIRVIRCKLE